MDQHSTPRSMRITGWVITGLVGAFLLFSSVIKLIGRPEVAETMTMLGWATDKAMLIGVIELACVLLYLFPPTAVLGAVLETALLGGAVATHTRIDSPLFSHTLFGVYMGLMVWAGIWLRDARIRALMPFVRRVS